METVTPTEFANASEEYVNFSTCIQNDAKGLVYQDGFMTTKKIFDLYLGTLLIVFGIGGNILSFATLGLMQGSTSLLLRALAVADTCYLVTMTVFQPLTVLHFYSKSFREQFTSFAYLDFWAFPLAGIAQTTAVWLTVLVTGERYLAICHPLRAKILATSRRIKASIAMTTLLAFCFNLPVFFDREIETITVPCTNISHPRAMVTEFFKGFYYQLIYKTIACFLLRTFLPLILLLFLNRKLLLAIRRSLEQQKSLVVSHQGDTARKSGEHFNLILFNVVTVFIVCETPDVGYRCSRAFIMYHGASMAHAYGFLTWFGLFSNFLLTLNSSVNFLVYFVTGEKFRNSFKRRFCACFPGFIRRYASVTMHGPNSPTTSTRVTTVSPGSPESIKLKPFK